MLKIIEKHFDGKLIRLSLILAFTYCLLFNSAVSIYKFDHYKATLFKAILELAKDFIYIYLFSFLMLFGLSINRILLAVGTVFLFLTGAVASYYLYCFNISPTKEIITSFFSTNLNEVSEIISIKLIIWLVFSLFVCIYTLKYFTIPDTKSFVTKLLSAICLFITLNNIISPQFKVLKNYFPVQYLNNTYLYFSQNTHTARVDISKNFFFIDNSDSDIIGVLVIGESARFDHFNINGYKRNTTPYLSSLSNLFSFKAQSSSNHTYISVPSILSRHDSNNLEETIKETSFLSVLTNLGFSTNWIGTQSLARSFLNNNLGGIYNDVDFSIIPGGSALFKLNDHDEKILPYFKDILYSQKSKQFFVLHTSGSHWNYSARHPQEFQLFTPVCSNINKGDPSTCDIENLINSYDNSILYTDFFLYKVIQLLENKNAFLIYVSDHGESLGENGYYGHGGPLIKEQTTIPFIVWMSEQFKAKHPIAEQFLSKRINEEISHAYVFHSILDCMSIESEIIDKNLSLCHDKNLPYRR